MKVKKDFFHETNDGNAMDVNQRIKEVMAARQNANEHIELEMEDGKVVICKDETELCNALGL